MQVKIKNGETIVLLGAQERATLGKAADICAYLAKHANGKAADEANAARGAIGIVLGILSPKETAKVKQG